jgi:hypothetical protein
MDAQRSCRSRTSSPTARTSEEVANSSDGIGSPKQSELNSAPVRSSRKPVVEGLSNSGGRKHCSDDYGLFGMKHESVDG